jgi:hypothetical protein
VEKPRCRPVWKAGPAICFSLFLGPGAAVAAIAQPPLAAHASVPVLDYQSVNLYATPTIIAQDDDDDHSEVSPGDVEKYVSVYKAMQRNRALTVEQAAAAQGMTVQAFRELENRIERDDSAREQARDELRAAASPQKSPAAPSQPESSPQQ